MNHIVFCINDAWTMQCSVLITSIQHYDNSNFAFHIISRNITAKNQRLLKQIVNSTNNICFHKITNIQTEKFIIRESDRVSIETYFRFFIPELLDNSINKVLYLDADILCAGKIDELFQIDLTDKAAGMALDSRYCEISKYNRLEYDMCYGYFNAGVMLINLDYWRKNNISQKLIDYVALNKFRCYFHDQDAINALLHDKIVRISPKYNLQTVLMEYFYVKNVSKCPREIYYDMKYEKKYWPELEKELYTPSLIHFTEYLKPWTKTCVVPFTKLWRHFYSLTPWKKYKLQKTYPPKNIYLKNTIKRIQAKINHKKCHFDDFPSEMYVIENKFLEHLKED